ncbi:hypothetical protein [Limosilactobacillus galli]|uniref:hypothetical protein n=1 Tax=Limosilactobacillus galli TaxID=2991834 RepID=UPI0024B990FD|nr:hypothetical protein [Limosilactobacillus galli]
MTELENTLTENQKDMHRLNNLIGAIPVETMMNNSEAVGQHLFAEVDRCKAIALTLGMVKEA